MGIQGIWYDRPKDRWRVRLYYRGKVCYCVYCCSFELALSAYHAGKARQAEIAQKKPEAKSFLDNIVERMLENDCKSCTNS